MDFKFYFVQMIIAQNYHFWHLFTVLICLNLAFHSIVQITKYNTWNKLILLSLREHSHFPQYLMDHEILFHLIVFHHFILIILRLLHRVKCRCMYLIGVHLFYLLNVRCIQIFWIYIGFSSGHVLIFNGVDFAPLLNHLLISFHFL